MKYFAAFIFVVLLSGCQSLPDASCSGTALIGGKETTVPIYGVRKVASQTQYKAGYPFNWQWVGKNNFTYTTCDK